MGANDPHGVATLDPREHQALQHTKYISWMPHGFWEED